MEKVLKLGRSVRHVVDQIIDQYLFADGSNRPWIIGFSGGKDSTAMLQLVWTALKEIKPLLWTREVYVICNDTLVENPLIASYVDEILEKIQEAAVIQGLPIKVKKTTPKLEDSFWVNVIGRGYPVPTSSFRWCTERLKISPTSRIIEEVVGEFGEAVILIGTRISESSTRAKSIKKHSKKGKRLSSHPNHHNVSVFSPIKHLMLEEVWGVINGMPSPWGADNSVLFDIYRNAVADDYECPTMVTNKKHKSCGQSRFGCWVCSLVSEDKSMSALVENGYEWMLPLLEFRNKMVEERNTEEARSPYRRNRQKAVNNLGVYRGSYRAKLLKRLLVIQKELEESGKKLELISKQELVAIQVIWHRDLLFHHEVSEIYNSVYPNEKNMKEKGYSRNLESKIIRDVLENDEAKSQLVADLLKLQKSKSLLVRKRGLTDDLQGRIEQYLEEKENQE